MTQSAVNPFPKKGSQQYRLLAALLAGERVTAISAIVSLNVMVVSARVSELRRMGWPIRSLDVPHPNRKDFPNEKLPMYFLDQHFRRWIATAGKGQHPALYGDASGRGKFAHWSLSDYECDQIRTRERPDSDPSGDAGD